jgi:hypothetical protein
MNYSFESFQISIFILIKIEFHYFRNLFSINMVDIRKFPNEPSLTFLADISIDKKMD